MIELIVGAELKLCLEDETTTQHVLGESYASNS